MDFIRKPEVLATVNAVGTASIYFILSKRLNSLTDEIDEIDTHLTSSIKKISENARSIQGITQTFQDVLVKFEEHRKVVANLVKLTKRFDDEFQEMNDKYELLVNAVKDLGGNVDSRRLKKKKKKSKYEERRRATSSESDSSASERDKVKEREKDREKDREKERERDREKEKKDKKSQRKDQKQDQDSSDEDFVKKAQEAKKTGSS